MPVGGFVPALQTLPLTVDYRGGYGITAEDDEELLLALEHWHRDRIRHLRLVLPLQKLVIAIDEEFPTLKYLIVDPWTNDSMALMLPETLQAPNPRHLALRYFFCPIRLGF